ncbi:acetyl-CoA carboxylase biotin carboxylase subunit family protein [Lysinimonas soli]|uniref:Acetyl-CoA carboxylase biotin carboxylase subunit family protein n=1 Tax=Lysinimonas soli TaxID=1074233 RepID=A0ABW0NKI3_9MICO
MTHSGGSLPLLAVVYGPLAHEQPIDRIAEAARGLCRLLWVLPDGDRSTRAALRYRKAAGEVEGDVLDASKLSVAEAADAVRSHAPDGITCFTDENIVWTAELAELLGLPYHSRRAAVQLTDKLEQRSAFAAHGLPTPAFWDADDLAEDAALAAVAAAGFPLVLKPRRGFGSVDTESIRSIEALRSAVAARVPGRMVLEGFIPDPTGPAFGVGSAPYVCVDLVVSGGSIGVLGMTGRTPLAEPFRETGSFFPADVPESARPGLVDAAIAAARALGVEVGVLRAEVKWTDSGPVVIEVNGRPDGGHTREFLKRALGVDSFQVAMRVALGEQFALEALPASQDVYFRFDLLPAAHLKRIDSVHGLDTVRAIPGVEDVIPGLRAGDEFSWRDGAFALVATVLGSAPDHPGVQRIRDEVYAAVVVSGTP